MLFVWRLARVAVATYINFQKLTIKVKRGRHGFGFSIASHGQERRVLAVAETSSGLLVSDRIATINGNDTKTQTHEETVAFIRTCTDSHITLNVLRPAGSVSHSGRNLQLLCCSANIGNTMPDKTMKHWVPQQGRVLKDGIEISYDVIVVGMQECMYKPTPGDEPDHAEFTSDEEHDEDEGKSKSTKGGWMTTFKDKFDESCTKHINKTIQSCLGAGYKMVAHEKVMQMRILVFAKTEHAESITDVETTKENTGLLSVLGNKGGVVAKMNIYGSSFCFVSTHLAAHEGGKHLEARNKNVAEIMSGSRLGNPSLDLGSQFTHAFWIGELGAPPRPRYATQMHSFNNTSNILRYFMEEPHVI